MAVFITSAWGFDPESWASLGFSQEVFRDRLSAELQDGDEVLIVGTDGVETDPDSRGRLLGLVTVSKRPVLTVDLVSPEARRAHEQRLRSGKWKFGLPYLSAERFAGDPLPATRSVVPRVYAKKLNRKIATGYERLTDDEAALVRALPRTPVSNIYDSPAIEKSRRATDWLTTLNRLSKGPPPSLKERLHRMSEGPAYTYILAFHGDLAAMLGKNPFEIGDRALWKIGWAIDPARRCSTINAFFPRPESCGWKVFQTKLLPLMADAYAVEQRVLSSLVSHSHRSEMVLCAEKHIAGLLEKCAATEPSVEERAGFRNDSVEIGG